MCHAEHTLFGVYNGVRTVGCEKHFGKFFLFAVIRQISRTVFLVGTEDKTEILCRLDAYSFQSLYSKQNRRRGALVVDSASAVKSAVLFGQFKGRYAPAASLGDNIKVTKYSQIGSSICMVKVRRAHIAVNISDMKPRLGAHFKHFRESAGGHFAERCALRSFAHYRGNTHQSAQVGYHFLRVRVDIEKNFIHRRALSVNLFRRPHCNQRIRQPCT